MTHRKSACALEEILNTDAGLRSLLEHSIEKAQIANPDPQKNPVHNLEEYYLYLDWTDQPLPWKGLSFAKSSTLPETIDQAMAYFFFLLDQPLDELRECGYFYPSLQYHPLLVPWVKDVFRGWGRNLSSAESWSEEYYREICSEPAFKMEKGWYELPENWHSFNDFFSRKLSSPSVRPVAFPEDDSVVVSPADAEFQGIWDIDERSFIKAKKGIAVKSGTFRSIRQILGPDSAYSDAFAGGKMTHAFLSLTDYHRYHFPVSGTVKEIRVLPGCDAAGGIMQWDRKNRRYNLELGEPEWQSVETRGCVIVETEKYGLAAAVPIAMCQVSSVNFSARVRVGDKVRKGDELGHFLFGGSDFMLIFQKQAGFSYTVDPAYPHVLTGRMCGKMED